MGVKGKPDIIDIIEKKGLQWYGHVNTLWTGDADLRLYITTVQDG